MRRGDRLPQTQRGVVNVVAIGYAIFMSRTKKLKLTVQTESRSFSKFSETFC